MSETVNHSEYRADMPGEFDDRLYIPNTHVHKNQNSAKCISNNKSEENIIESKSDKKKSLYKKKVSFKHSD